VDHFEDRKVHDVMIMDGNKVIMY